ncbi:MAG: Mrp/NBP35 family ATP-binding protein [Planctomycetota bacterium]|nr:Mrp/NBP35 family ATP-binding protein [Planctomycetota bacterium]MDA1113249.1 Mrp/NBP35 family ATP-binding protein [Planctomycetota bacterium]
MNDKEAVLEALKIVQDPDLHKDIVTLGFIKDLAVCAGVVKFKIELTTPACPVKEQLKQQAYDAVIALEGVETVNIEMTAQVKSSLPVGNQLGGDIKHVIAVTSGKGGVGKSTCAVNLAAALSATGAKVGILDADVYGPNVPVMMGIHRKPEGRGKKLFPIKAHGIKTMSVGYMIEDGQPVMWRGPMLHRALQQFLQDVEWGELDYLIVDMPPGTGDAQLSLAQLVPLTGMVVVTTPQEVSQTDVRRAIGMAKQVKTTILGVIENMTGEIFGDGGGKTISEKFDIPFLGSIPLQADVRRCGDSGVPVVVEDPDSNVAQIFRTMAGKVAAEVSKLQATSLPVLEV